MNKILNIKKATELSKQLKQEGKSVVLIGGCFDVLHTGHVEFFKKAKTYGDVLFVLLESDETIKKLKGKNRPIHTQTDRAKVLATIEPINTIIMLPQLENNNDYDSLISKLKPTIIATTTGDPNRYHKERQAKLIQAKVIDVVSRIKNKSTNQLTKLL
ncbi:MAG: adenylyltransferase/cytidyltransferase family protein [Candidatus Levyibacteriota bacterium]|nr:MAG: adenylyltransferase/cytidyltransferase family protein [Candidatus Levybacteria bacterium]